MKLLKQNFTLFAIIFINNFILLSQVTKQEILLQKEIENLKDKLEYKENNKYRFDPIYQFDDSIKIIDKELSKDQLTIDELKYFGYNFFTESTNKSTWNNQPPPLKYVLGPGDEVIIEIWGDTQLRVSHTINQYGNIYVDKIGQIHIAGETLSNLENKLLKKFQNVYSSLKGDKPTAYMDISIGKLKSINITMLGESGMPGVHTIHPFSSIITALLQTGGVLVTGSLREIRLIRDGKTIQSFDFYQYLINGELQNDFRLLNNDIIFVPIRNSTITIGGEILKQAMYELTDNETIEDLVKFAGGLTIKSIPNMRINRITTKKDIKNVMPYNETFFIDYLNESDYVLNNGDEIFVYAISESLHSIYIYGQVKNPGEYSFNTSSKMRIIDIMNIAGGFNDSTFMKTVYLNEAEIIRNNPNTQFAEVITFNIQSLLNGDPTHNHILQNWDIILIRENPKFKSPEKIIISGEVAIPGVYTLQKRWEGLDNILMRAGGFTEKAYVDGLQLFRNGNQIAISDYNITLMNGDSISVPQPSGVVHILGAVNRPGYVQYERNKSLNKYIESSGGFNLNADKLNITIIYANGDVKINKRFRITKINNGSTIIVYDKKQEDPFDVTEFATNLASITTSIATLLLLIMQTN